MSNLSFVQHAGDGVTTTFLLAVNGDNIGYLRTEDIHVYVDGVEVDFTIQVASPHLAILNEAPVDGAVVIIRRQMPQDATYSDFSRGNVFSQRNMNNSFLQDLYLTQELLDGFLPEGTYQKQDMDFGDEWAPTRLRAPVNDSDATRKVYVDDADNALDARVTEIENTVVTGGTRFISYLYKNGSADGGELFLTVPYAFQSINRVYINGMNQTQGMAWDYDVNTQLIELAEELYAGDEVVIEIGFEPEKVLDNEVVSGNAEVVATGTTKPRSLADRFGDVINVKNFGAIGDKVTDDTVAIDLAIDRWVEAVDGSTLLFPDGSYVYSGNKVADLGFAYGKTVICQGVVAPSTQTGVAITLRNAEQCSFDLKVKGGGVAGDFSLAEGHGGSEFFRGEALVSCKINVVASSYAGRLVRLTTNQSTLRRSASNRVDLDTRGRPQGSVSRIGQPLYTDQLDSVTIGAGGWYTWRGEGSQYGPVFERMADIYIDVIEAGEFINSGVEFRGTYSVLIDTLYVGESDVGTPTDLVKFVRFNTNGLQCYNVYIDKFRGLRGVNGIYADQFAFEGRGLRIGNMDCTSDVPNSYALKVNSVRDVSVNSLSVGGDCNAFECSGTNEAIDLRVLSSGTHDSDLIKLAGSGKKVTIRGILTGGTAGSSLVNIIDNNDVLFDNVVFDSNDVDQKVNIGFAGANQIKFSNGENNGDSPLWNSPRNPHIVQNVIGSPTKTSGQYTLPDATTSQTISHQCSRLPFVSVTPFSSGIVNLRLTSVTSTDFTINYDSLSGAKTIQWQADAEKALGDNR